MKPAYRREEWLRNHYCERGWTQQEMADACGVSPRTIREWMTRHGVETRDIAGVNHPLYGEERDESVKDQISETLSGREFDEETRRKMAEATRGRTLSAEVRRKISDSLSGITRSTETRRRMSEASAGTNNANWRGGYGNRYGGGWAVARSRALERDQHVSTANTTAASDASRSTTLDRSGSSASRRRQPSLMLTTSRTSSLSVVVAIRRPITGSSASNPV